MIWKTLFAFVCIWLGIGYIVTNRITIHLTKKVTYWRPSKSLTKGLDREMLGWLIWPFYIVWWILVKVLPSDVYIPFGKVSFSEQWKFIKFRAYLFTHTIFMIGFFLLGYFFESSSTFFWCLYAGSGFVNFLGACLIMRKRVAPEWDTWHRPWLRKSLTDNMVFAFVMCLLGPFAVIPITKGIDEANDFYVG